MKELISTGAIKNIALVGISKNAGKTSVLNTILQSYPRINWAVMSTGIDGETEDRVYKTPKPPLHLSKGTLFCCDALSADIHGSAISILHASSSGGRTHYIARAEIPLDTCITGPSALSRQKATIAMMHSLGAQKVLVDGSLDRKSIALEDSIDALILAVGASYGKSDSIINEISRLLALRDIPKVNKRAYTRRRLTGADSILLKRGNRWRDTGYRSLIMHEDKLSELLGDAVSAVYIPTSITERSFEKLFSRTQYKDLQIIVRHPECLKLSLSKLKKLQSDTSVSCLIPFKIKAFTLNSSAIGADLVYAEEFRDKIRSAFPNEHFLDIMEI
jgi:predicted nucleotidyltransferase